MNRRAEELRNHESETRGALLFFGSSVPPFLRSSVRSGFTLVEMLMVATIFSIVALGMASSFVSGMRVWGRAQHRDTAHADALLAFEVMARELRQSVDIPKVKFEGTTHELSFPAVLGDAIVKVTYLYDAYDKRLRRRQVDLKDILEEKLEPDYREKTLFPSADDVLIEFASFNKNRKDIGEQSAEETRYEWRDSWDKEDGIPWAIRLTITVKHETLTKTVWLPIS